MVQEHIKRPQDSIGIYLVIFDSYKIGKHRTDSTMLNPVCSAFPGKYRLKSNSGATAFVWKNTQRPPMLNSADANIKRVVSSSDFNKTHPFVNSRQPLMKTCKDIGRNRKKYCSHNVKNIRNKSTQPHI